MVLCGEVGGEEEGETAFIDQRAGAAGKNREFVHKPLALYWLGALALPTTLLVGST